MILLDTDYLIRMLVNGTQEAERVSDWVRANEPLITSSICWYEFESGPVDAEGISLVTGVLRDRIIPFTGDHAREAARLYNNTGRQRRLRIDAMIAATAIVTGATLATANSGDFEPFIPLGLRRTGKLTFM